MIDSTCRDVGTFRPLATDTDAHPSSFHVMVTGQIESAEFPPHVTNAYCRYIVTHGPDWNLIHGMDSGLSQIARRSSPRKEINGQPLLWNLPLDVALRSTNISGWPRVALSVHGLDIFGRDVVRGYGSVGVPTCPGRFALEVCTYVPLEGSLCRRFWNWLYGTPPEYYDMRFVVGHEGRAVTRVKSEGTLRVVLNVTTRDISRFGYCVSNVYCNSRM